MTQNSDHQKDLHYLNTNRPLRPKFTVDKRVLSAKSLNSIYQQEEEIILWIIELYRRRLRLMKWTS